MTSIPFLAFSSPDRTPLFHYPGPHDHTPIRYVDLGSTVAVGLRYYQLENMRDAYTTFGMLVGSLTVQVGGGCIIPTPKRPHLLRVPTPTSSLTPRHPLHPRPCIHFVAAKAG